MNKKGIIISIGIISLLLGSCSDTQQYEDSYITGTNPAGTVRELPTIDQMASQNGMDTHQAESDTGLYTIHGALVQYYDFKTNKNMVWCNQANCEHNNSNCSAYVPADSFNQDYIFYQNHKIYLISKNDNGAYLEQYEEDGTNRVKLGKLWTVNSGVIHDPSVTISHLVRMHSGKIYYCIIDNYKTVQICSMELKQGASPVVIEEYRTDGERMDIYSFNIYEKYLYYSIGETVREELKGGFYAYNIDTQELQALSEKPVNSYIVNNGLLHYIDSENRADILSKNMETGEVKKVITGNSWEGCESYYLRMMGTSDYIILDNTLEMYYGKGFNKEIPVTLTVYDYEGRLIKSIEWPSDVLLSFNDRFVTKYVQGRAGSLELYICFIYDGFDNMEWIKIN